MDKYLIEEQFRKLKNLYQYRDYSPEQLYREAFRRVITNQIDLDSLFIDKKERKIAKHLLRKYLDDFTPETISDINILRDILFLEILNARLQDKINRDASSNTRTIEAIHKNLNQIISLKSTLGIAGGKKGESVDTKIKQLMKKFEIWRRNNNGSRTIICPYCGQMVLLKIRTDAWEAGKHPFFKDRVLYNHHLMNLYLQRKITKQDVAKILECSEDYIDWLLQKAYPTNPDFKRLRKFYNEMGKDKVKKEEENG